MARSTPFSLILLLALASPVFAQGTEPDHMRARLVELGGGLTMAVFPGEGGGFTPTAQARINVIRSLAVELSTHWWDGSGGVYDLRLRVAPGEGGLASPYFTIGGLGSFQSRYVREIRTTLPTGDVIVYPAHRHGRITRPFATTFGGGTRIHLFSRTSVDAGGEMWLADGLAFALRTTFMIGIGPRR